MEDFRFTMDDAAAASGLPKAALETLQKRGLAPVSLGGGRRRTRLFDDHGVAQFGLAGALYRAGVELLPAARVARAFVESLPGWMNDPFVPDGLVNFERLPEALAIDRPGLSAAKAQGRFPLFCALADRLGEARLTTATRGEIVLEIVDRTYVFAGNADLQSTALFSDGGYELTASHRIEGWERGEDLIRLVSIDDEAREDPYSARHVEREYHEARARAVAALRVNVSLATRRTFAGLRAALLARGVSPLPEFPGDPAADGPSRDAPGP